LGGNDIGKKASLAYASKDANGRVKLEKLKQSLIDADVEISDEMFILKAEDAQRLLEPRRLARFIVERAGRAFRRGGRFQRSRLVASADRVAVSTN
jgi:hypothetical protein